MKYYETMIVSKRAKKKGISLCLHAVEWDYSEVVMNISSTWTSKGGLALDKSWNS